MLIGAPASGKSTLRQRLVEIPNTVVICPDDLRESFPEWSSDNNALFAHVHKEIGQHLTTGHDVVYDALNIFPLWRRSVLAVAYRAQSTMIGIHLDTPLEDCLERHRLRPKNASQGALTDEIITRHWQALQLNRPAFREGFNRIYRITPDDDAFVNMGLIA